MNELAGSSAVRPCPDDRFLATARPSPSWRLWAGACVIVAAALAVYLPALWNGDFLWDDDTHLTANLITQPHGLRDSWLTDRQHNYWPVTWTAFWAQWRLWQDHPRGYRLVTVALHGLVAVSLWLLLRALRSPGAWLAALFFALHPVNAETAGWITQQKNEEALRLRPHDPAVLRELAARRGLRGRPSPAPPQGRLPRRPLPNRKATHLATTPAESV